MNYYHRETVVTPNGDTIEPVTVDMVVQDLQLEESAVVNRERLTLLIRRVRAKVEDALNKRIAVVVKRAEVRTPVNEVSVDAPIIKVAYIEVYDPETGEWTTVDGEIEHSDREVYLPDECLDRVVRIVYSVGMAPCPYQYIGDILEGVRAEWAGQPWTPPDYPDRRSNA